MAEGDVDYGGVVETVRLPATVSRVVPGLGEWLADRLWVVWVLAVVVLGAGYSGRWLPGPDSATHVLMAEALVSGEAMAHPEDAHRKVEPGLSWVIAGLRGMGGWWAVQGGMVAMGLATLALGWGAARLAMGRGAAAGVLLLMVVSETWVRYSLQALTDMPFAVGAGAVLLGYGVVRGGWLPWRVWVGVGLVLAGLVWCAAFRSVWLVVAASVVVAAGVDLARARRWGWLAGAVVGGAGALLVVRALVTGVVFGMSRDEASMWARLTEGLSETVWRGATEELPRLMGESLGEGLVWVDAGWWVALPVAVIGLAGVVGVSWRMGQTLWLVMVGLFVAQWLAFMVVDRYALPVLVVFAAGWWWVAGAGERWLSVRRDKPAGGAWAVVLLVGWLGLNAVGVGQTVWMFRDEPYRVESRYDHGRYAGMDAAVVLLNAEAGAGAAVLNRTSVGSDVWAVRTGARVYDGHRQRPWRRSAERWVVVDASREGDRGMAGVREAEGAERLSEAGARFEVWRVGEVGGVLD